MNKEEDLERAQLDALAARIYAAQRGRQEIDRLTLDQPDLGVAAAYAVQSAVIARYVASGDRVVGMKAGLTSKPKQEAMGVHEPIYGSICESMVLDEGEPLRAAELIHPRGEPEIAFLLAGDLRGPGVKVEDVLAATREVVPAIEIIDSRYRDFKFTLADVVADNASSARVVLGARGVPPSAVDLRYVGMVFEKNGEIVETGAGAAVLGHPANAVAWLANKLAERGEWLRAGQFVMPGALSNAHTLAPGDEIRATFDHVGSVALRVV